MTVVRHTQSCITGILSRAVRKCLVAMRLRVSVNKKQMLSVVNAGASAGVVVCGTSPSTQATATSPTTTPAAPNHNHHHHRTMNHHHVHHHHHRLRSTTNSPVGSGGSTGSSTLPMKDPLSAGGTTTAGRHQYAQRGVGYHAPVCLASDAVNLPPSIALPDGEDYPYSTRVLHLRNHEQESEIYQKCTRPPPNRTVNDSESPPPYRCSSAGLLSSTSAHHTAISSITHQQSTTNLSSQYPVTRCHSLTSSTTPSSSTTTSKRPSLLSNSSSSSSCSSSSTTTSGGTAELNAIAGTTNTDFLHRTVQILTGTKRATQQQQQQSQSQCGTGVASVVGVMVPTNRTGISRRDTNNPSGGASGSSSPTNRHNRPPV